MAHKNQMIRKSLRRCPTCGSTRIRTIVGEYQTCVQGEGVTIHDLERDECPACGEVLFSPEAMRQMETYRKASVKAGKTR